MDKLTDVASEEAETLAGEVQYLHGLVRSSLADQRDWFQIQVRSKQLVAVQPATTESAMLTLEQVARTEAATGCQATRLRRLLTPIAELRLDEKGP